MAAAPSLVARSKLLPLLAIGALAGALSAQSPLTLEQAAARRPSDLLPANLGAEVTLSGQASGPAVPLTSYSHLAIQDEHGYGFVIDANHSRLDRFRAGDWVEARGTLGHRAGLPVLFPTEIRVVRQTVPPAPKRLPVEMVRAFRYQGTLVTIEARVLDQGDNAGGEYLMVGDRSTPLKIFLSKAARGAGRGLAGFKSGDKVRITGIASQYSVVPPFNRLFQVMIARAEAVELLESGWLVPPQMVLLAVMAMLGALLVWWRREVRTTRQRRSMQALNQLGESVFAASTRREILERASVVVPQVFAASGLRLYLHDCVSRELECVESGPVKPAPGVVGSGVSSFSRGAAMCFRNRALLHIPDTRRSPLVQTPARAGTTKSPGAVMFIPMFAQGEVMGVLELSRDRARGFSQDEQAAAQHLANQIATALRLLDQRSMREQLFRTEKLAAAGQLITGVANELRTPLACISSLIDVALSHHGDRDMERDLQAVAAAASRASEIIARLVSFARSEGCEPAAVDLNALLAELIRFREPEYCSAGGEYRTRCCAGELPVLAIQAQIEQVLLNLLMYAEQFQAVRSPRAITAVTRRSKGRALVEIEFPTPGGETNPFSTFDGRRSATALGLGVCRGMIQSHEGEIYFTRLSEETARFTLDMPAAQTASEGEHRSNAEAVGIRPLTALVIEPDEDVARQIVRLLGTAGHRAVPLAPQQALETIERIDVDVIFCSAVQPGWDWMDFWRQVRGRVRAVVLLGETPGTELARGLPGADLEVLPTPADQAAMDRLLQRLAPRFSEAPVVC
jgi:signal transduction histidine kinase/CheY-like chemotaxis protein